MYFCSLVSKCLHITHKFLLMPQDIDDSAPDLWKSMMNDRMPADFYERLDLDQRFVIDRWKDRRVVLLRKRMHQEMDAKLEEVIRHPIKITRLIKLLVRSIDDIDCLGASADAMLTIWNPSEEQLDTIKEDTAFRMKNIQVKQHRFDGLLQLSANSNTPMRVLLGAFKKTHGTRNFTSISRLFTNAVRLTVDQSAAGRHRQIDFIGAVICSDLRAGMPESTILVTDESGKLLRIKFGNGTGKVVQTHLSHIVPTSLENVQRACTVAAFKGLQLCGMDSELSCVVAKYTDRSSLELDLQNPRVDQLKLWWNSEDGRSKLLQLASCTDLYIQHPPSHELRAIGYMAKLLILSNARLAIEVDCGNSTTLVLKLPLSLVSDFASLCGDLHPHEFFMASEESKIEELKLLRHILQSRRNLYNFRLRHVVEPVPEYPEIEFEIVHIALTETRALAALYSTMSYEF